MAGGRTAVVFCAAALGGCSLFFGTGDLTGDDGRHTPDATSSVDGTTPDGGIDDGALATDGALDPSLVALWTFDDAASSGTVPDKTGHGHDMVLTGAQVDPAGGK